jgi:hypothetical protein
LFLWASEVVWSVVTETISESLFTLKQSLRKAYR